MTDSEFKLPLSDELEYDIPQGPGSGLVLALAYDRVLRKKTEANLRSELAEERELGSTDPVTGLYNRRYMEQEEERIHRAGKYGKLVIDLDGFKEGNDTHGHLVGDRILKHVGVESIVKNLKRRGDIAGRTGGDEYTVLLPGLDNPLALALIGNRMRSGLITSPYMIDHKTPAKITMSVGGTISNHVPHELIEDITQRADASMYASKERGKDSVSVFYNGSFFRFGDSGLIVIGNDVIAKSEKMSNVLARYREQEARALEEAMHPRGIIIRPKPPENTQT